MRCVFEGNCVKVFGRAIHALSRIGDEIWLDPLQKGLAVRSVNLAQSAYACFLFSPLFFQHYTPNLDKLQENKGVKCKVSLKSVAPLFRSVATIDRNVHRCEITVNVLDNRVIFQFHCRHGITKTHNLGYQECEALQAVFPAHLCPNVIQAQPKLLSDIVMHFSTSQEEITLSVSPIRVNLKNYCEDENGLAKNHISSMNTEMSLHPDEFDYIQVGVDSDITFCLKELRGFLSFAESHGLTVTVHFGATGKPVSFSVEDMVLEAVVVLATLASPDRENPSQVSNAQRPHSPRNTSEPCPANTSLAGISIHEGPLEAEAAVVAYQHRPAFLPGEQVASSQGSPVFSPAFHMRKLLQIQGEELDLLRPKTPLCGISHESPLTTAVTPATFKMRSLLFGAVASDQEDVSALELPSLVCASDTEDDAGDCSGRVEE